MGSMRTVLPLSTVTARVVMVTTPSRTPQSGGKALLATAHRTISPTNRHSAVLPLAGTTRQTICRQKLRILAPRGSVERALSHLAASKIRVCCPMVQHRAQSIDICRSDQCGYRTFATGCKFALYNPPQDVMNPSGQMTRIPPHCYLYDHGMYRTCYFLARTRPVSFLSFRCAVSRGGHCPGSLRRHPSVKLWCIQRNPIWPTIDQFPDCDKVARQLGCLV